MKFEPTNIVRVFYQPENKKILVGQLILKNRKLFFEYDSNFIKTNLNISPIKLPLQSSIIESNDFTFDGLFGVFNDSLPDGWGRLLLDRALLKHIVYC